MNGECGGGEPVFCGSPPVCQFYPARCSEGSGGCLYTNLQNYTSYGDNGEFCYEGDCYPCVTNGNGICFDDPFFCCSFSTSPDPLNPGVCYICD